MAQRGRRQGTRVTYSPAQKQRYQSRQRRYDEGFTLYTAQEVVYTGNPDVFQFIRPSAPLGYWEVKRIRHLFFASGSIFACDPADDLLVDPLGDPYYQAFLSGDFDTSYILNSDRSISVSDDNASINIDAQHNKISVQFTNRLVDEIRRYFFRHDFYCNVPGVARTAAALNSENPTGFGLRYLSPARENNGWFMRRGVYYGIGTVPFVGFNPPAPQALTGEFSPPLPANNCITNSTTEFAYRIGGYRKTLTSTTEPEFYCNCPDFARTWQAHPNAEFQSESVDRDWSASEAGALDDCKHIYAVRFALGQTVPYPSDVPLPLF
jgi:hypothetical protein